MKFGKRSALIVVFIATLLLGVLSLGGCSFMKRNAHEHSFTYFISNEDVSCTHDGTATAYCDYGCGATETIVEEYKLPHRFSTYVTSGNATCEQDATKTAYCDYGCGATDTIAEVGTATGHNFVDKKCITCSALDTHYFDVYNTTYGYDYLGTMQNGSNRQTLYERMDDISRKFHVDETFDAKDLCVQKIYYDDLELTNSEALSVWFTFKEDNPVYYWISNKVIVSDNFISLLTVEDYAKGKTRIALNKELEDKLTLILSSVKTKSFYNKVLALHDYILGAVQYAHSAVEQVETALWAHNIVGVLKGRGAVCEGYAKTFQLLLNACGIENVLVVGMTSNGAHAWNMVRMDDDRWYWFDLTWDDVDSALYANTHRYFCVYDGQFVTTNPITYFSTDHKPYTPDGEGFEFQYALPSVSKTKYTGKK